MRIHAGTSGWSYAAWKGRFYPPDLPASRMLPAYAGRLDAVEVNATFHRMPRPGILAGWRAQVPSSFRFTLKAPRRITFRPRLVGAEGTLRTFLQRVGELGPSVGPILFQVPPTMKRDLPGLREFLALLPRGLRLALEFREPSWLEDGVFTALAEAGAALCLTDAEEGPTPLAATAGFGYLRLRRPDYDRAALAGWLKRISAQPWSEAFAFFRHEDEARGPQLAMRLATMAAAEGPASTSPFSRRR